MKRVSHIPRRHLVAAPGLFPLPASATNVETRVNGAERSLTFWSFSGVESEPKGQKDAKQD
jgi:hypothetical protein